MASKVGSSPASTPLDHGKFVVSGIADSTPSTLPPNSGSAEQMAKTASSISYNQQLKQEFKQAVQKPATWGILVALHVLVFGVVLIIRAYKKRKQRELDADQTRMMMRWHQDRDSV